MSFFIFKIKKDLKIYRDKKRWLARISDKYLYVRQIEESVNKYFMPTEKLIINEVFQFDKMTKTMIKDNLNTYSVRSYHNKKIFKMSKEL